MSFRQEFWSGKKLCSQEDLKSNSATEIILRDGEQLCSVIVVNFENDLRVFYNSCPHARLPLNIKKDKFFDISGRYLFCSSHGAFFVTRGNHNQRSLQVLHRQILYCFDHQRKEPFHIDDAEPRPLVLRFGQGKRV